MVVAMMWPTVRSILDIWSTSETFTHGYLVIPAFLWLVWRKREDLARLEAKPEWRVLPLIALFGACWFVSGLAGIQVGEHAALALIIMSTIWAIVGTRIAKAIQFPILFLFFLAPVGEELVPYLMELTADVTVWAIRNTGIPIYREGLFFSLPSGNWSVVEACSGINYLISSISLGSLYAYLNFTSYKIRLIFMLIATLLPIVANSVRAYIIVMLGHFSGNKLATGVDHLIYGWLFFGIVMFLLFSIGNLLPNPSQQQSAENAESSGETPVSQHGLFPQRVALTLAVVLAVGTWPTWANLINNDDSELLLEPKIVSTLLPTGIISSENPDSNQSLWQPSMRGFDHRLDAVYSTTDSQPVRAMAFVYVTQHQGKEMISSSNVLIRNQQDDWRRISTTINSVTTRPGEELEVIETLLDSDSQTLKIWQWYEIGSRRSTNPLKVKGWELLDKVMFRNSLSTTYILATENTQNANYSLTNALKIMLSEQ